MLWVEKLVDAARRYADADRSDPFALARARTHIRVGIAVGDFRYDATPATETRFLPDGTSYPGTVYRHVQRP